jgi:hypothetical protein
MDAALPAPAGLSIPFDRRHLVRLVLTGAAGVALAESIPLMRGMSADGPTVTIGSLQRTMSALATTYEVTSPAKTAVALKGAERTIAMTAATMTPGRQRVEFRATYAQVLTMLANTAADRGDPQEAGRVAILATKLGREIGDHETVGHAYAVQSGALLGSGSPRSAVKAAQNGVSYAGQSPAAAMALVAEAEAWAHLGHASAVLDVVQAAETHHSTLPESVWGRPGYSLRSYHPGYVKAFGAAALIRVGLYDEARPRLDEAAELLNGPGLDGIRSYLALSRARVAAGTGAYDEAREWASVGVALSLARPSAWVAGIVKELDTTTGGKMADLVAQTGHSKV